MARKGFKEYTPEEQADIRVKAKAAGMNEESYLDGLVKDDLAKVDQLSEYDRESLSQKIEEVKRDNVEEGTFAEECDRVNKELSEKLSQTDIEELVETISKIDRDNVNLQLKVNQQNSEIEELKEDHKKFTLKCFGKESESRESDLESYITRVDCQKDISNDIDSHSDEVLAHPDKLSAIRLKQYTSDATAGGSASETLTFPGLLNTDKILAVTPTEGTKLYESYGKFASLVVQDLTYAAVGIGKSGNDLTIEYTDGATAGSEVVTVNGNDISIQIETGVSTATQIKTAFDLVSAATDLASCSVSGTGSNTQTTEAKANLEDGDRDGESMTFTWAADPGPGKKLILTVLTL